MKNRMIIVVVLLFIYTLQSQAQITLQATDDSYIYQSGEKADLTYGLLDPDVLITRKSVASSLYTRETYLMFEIGDQTSSFQNARVELYGEVVDSKDIEIYYTDTTWNEETLTGSNRPSGFIINKTFQNAGENYHSWDVTSYVNSAKLAGVNKISFILKDIAGAVSTVDTKWHSKENPSGFAPGLILTAGDPPEIYNGSYYIDQINGNDSNSGHTPEEAWKSLVNIENIIFQAGDSLLFKSGCEWTATFSPLGSGLPGKPIVIGKYGGEVRPVINGGGLATNTISLNNQHHIELRDLAITNLGVDGVFKRAVYYHAADMGAINHIIFDNLEVYDVNGDMDNKNNGGIFIEISGSAKPTWFDTLIISNCHIHDVNRTGLSNASIWDNRTLNENENWTPSKNVHIHHNTFQRTGANALIVRVSHKPLMEYNLFDHCSIIGSGNASFSFNTDSAIWQYNEARYTKYNDGDNDAGGFDSDYRSKHTIIQYNYSHHNEYGGVLLTGGPGTGTGFNEGTIVRYNVFANNDKHIIRTSGNLTNSKIYNNVFYTGSELEGVDQLWHKSWGGGLSDGTYYWNNIFYNEGINSSFDFTTSTNNEFSNNVFFGNPSTGQPYDPAGIYEDPLLLNPGGDSDGFEAVFQYMIKAGSPAIDQGIEVEGNAITDLEGNKIPLANAIDIGAFEWHADTLDVLIIVKDENQLLLEGAEVWLDGNGVATTDNNGEVVFTDVLTGVDIPLTIDYTGYSILGGSLPSSLNDTAIFMLSQNAFDLKLVASDDTDKLLEDVEFILPGIDTLISDINGEVVFVGITESSNVLYKAEKNGYHLVSGTLEFNANDSLMVLMNPRLVSFEIRDADNTPINEAVVVLDGYGSVQTDNLGEARFMFVSENEDLQYSVEKSGFSIQEGNFSIFEDDVKVRVFLDPTVVQFRVVDWELLALFSAAVLFNDELKYTNEEGLVTFTKAPLNEYISYSIYQSGFATLNDSVFLTETGETIYVVMNPPPAYNVFFSVSDMAENAISNALVTLSGYGIMLTNTEGKATFENVVSAENIIYNISKTGYKDTVNILNVVDEDVEVSIILLDEFGTSINSFANENSGILFPNPASDFININLSEHVVKFFIYDVHGRLMYNDRNSLGNIKLDISTWDSGMYYLQMLLKNGMSETPEKFFILK